MEIKIIETGEKVLDTYFADVPAQEKHLNSLICLLKYYLPDIYDKLPDTKDEHLYLVSDTHGDYLSLAGFLKALGLIDFELDSFIYSDVVNNVDYTKKEYEKIPECLKKNMKFIVHLEPNINFGCVKKMIILGDIVDRGPESTISLYLLKHIFEKFREKGKDCPIILLAGNHEIAKEMTEEYFFNRKIYINILKEMISQKMMKSGYLYKDAYFSHTLFCEEHLELIFKRIFEAIFNNKSDGTNVDNEFYFILKKELKDNHKNLLLKLNKYILLVLCNLDQKSAILEMFEKEELAEIRTAFGDALLKYFIVGDRSDKNFATDEMNIFWERLENIFNFEKCECLEENDFRKVWRIESETNKNSVLDKNVIGHDIIGSLRPLLIKNEEKIILGTDTGRNVALRETNSLVNVICVPIVENKIDFSKTFIINKQIKRDNYLLECKILKLYENLYPFDTHPSIKNIFSLENIEENIKLDYKNYKFFLENLHLIKNCSKKLAEIKKQNSDLSEIKKCDDFVKLQKNNFDIDSWNRRLQKHFSEFGKNSVVFSHIVFETIDEESSELFFLEKISYCDKNFKKFTIKDFGDRYILVKNVFNDNDPNNVIFEKEKSYVGELRDKTKTTSFLDSKAREI